MRFASIQLAIWLTGLLTGLSDQRAFAQVAAPSQGGGVDIVEVTATTMKVRFGINGTGAGRVLAIATMPYGAPVPLAAADGQFYTASPAYGQGSTLGEGYAVYNGTEHSTIITDLKPNTRYYVTNAEYNTDGTSIAYNISGTSMSTPTSKVVPLPVELTTFNGTLDTRNCATLHWTTATELNSNYFALERSTDGSMFAEVGRMAAGHTSSSTLGYKWPDPQPLTQLTYYRLRQVDLDGKSSYSSVVALSPKLAVAQQLEVYPNPSAGRPVQLFLKGYQETVLILSLTDNLGRSVLVQHLTPSSVQYLAPLALPQDFAPGTYVLTLAGSGTPVKKRIILSE